MFDINAKDIGTVFTSLREAITGKKIVDGEAKDRILLELSKLEADMYRQHANVIVAEAKSDGFLTRSWRPITMLTFVFIIANNYIIAPYAEVVFGVHIPVLDITDDMWTLLQYGLGGYIMGRTIEKSVDSVAKRKA